MRRDNKMRGIYSHFFIIFSIIIMGGMLNIVNISADPDPQTRYSGWMGDTPAIDQFMPTNNSIIYTNSTNISWKWFHYSDVGYGYFDDVKIELLNDMSVIFEQNFSYYNNGYSVYPCFPDVFNNTLNFNTTTYNIQYGDNIRLNFTLTYISGDGINWAVAKTTTVSTIYLLRYEMASNTQTVITMGYIPYMILGLAGIILVPLLFARGKKSGGVIIET